MYHHLSIRNHLIAARRRKLRVAFLLALFLGPLGLFYTDPFGGLAMLSASLVLLLMFPVTVLIIIWIICIAWAVSKVKRSHRVADMYAPYFSSSRS
jgi:hypothetical protein